MTLVSRAPVPLGRTDRSDLIAAAAGFPPRVQLHPSSPPTQRQKLDGVPGTQDT